MNWKQYSDCVKEVTLENAKEWYAEQDKFVYCIDLLEISVWDDNSDALVNALENKFTKMLKKENFMNTADVAAVVLDMEAGTLLEQVQNAFVASDEKTRDRVCGSLVDQMREIDDLNNVKWFTKKRLELVGLKVSSLA